MFRIKPALTAALIALAGASALTGCGSSNDDNFDDRANTAEPKARFVHAIPAGPAVTLFRQGAPIAGVTGVDYKFGSQYFGVDTGVSSYSLHTVTGDREVATAQIDAQRGRKYTLLAFPATSGVELATIDDPFSKSLVSDNARVRVVNGSPNAAPIDVYMTGTTVDLNAANPNFAAIGYKNANPASGADSLSFEANTYLLRITEAGAKSAIFTKTVVVPRNADWLLVTLAASGSGIVRPNDIRVLLVRADDAASATDELTSD